MKYLLILFIALVACNQDYPEPKTKVSFLVGTWVPKDTTQSTYIFNDDLTGKMSFENHWYDITYTYDNIQVIKINWYGRISQYWLYDQTQTYFRLCVNSTNCKEYNKK